MPGPDLILLGDSHTGALHQAAVARGMDARLLYINGNFWHENRMRWHPRMGIGAKYRPRLQRQIRDLAQSLGGTVFPADTPVLASIGYHLGRLVPRLARLGHTPDPLHAETDDRLFLSQAFLDAYILSQRGNLIDLLASAARVAPVVVIAPPMIQTDPVALYVANRITEVLMARGVRVFDPRREPDWAGQPLPEALRAPDQVHGNAAYGEAVLARLFDRGLLPGAA